MKIKHQKLSLEPSPGREEKMYITLKHVLQTRGAYRSISIRVFPFSILLRGPSAKQDKLVVDLFALMFLYMAK